MFVENCLKNNTMARSAGALLCLIIVGLVRSGSKFKSCSTSGFCQRQKTLKTNAYFVRDDVKIENDVLIGQMVHRDFPDDDS